MPGAERLAELRREIGRYDLADRFRILHDLGVYHHRESMSGEGSSLAETTALRTALPGLLRRHSVASVLDVPCGDFHWMREVDLAGASYLGVDIVPELIERNRLLYGSPQREFRCLDATRDALPAVDLIHCRDLIIHLSLADIARLLTNFAASGARLLLVSHFASRTGNPEIESGDFRPVNLCHPPFSLPEPLEVLDEGSAMGGGAFADRAMALWRAADLR